MGGTISRLMRWSDKERSTNKVMCDYVSDLPEVIIQHILSFLETKEAARASILSKSWRRAWSTRHFLNFDFGAITFQKCDPRMEDMLLQFVDDTLESYDREKIPIQKFRLRVDAVTPSKLFPLLKKWLRIVLQNGVRELDFNTSWEDMELPEEIFGNKWLQALKVTSLVWGYKLVLDNTVIKCGNLKKLELERIAIDAITFHNLTCHYPLIEELQLKDCGWPNIHIANLPNLRILCLECFGVISVAIDAQKLESLICRCSGALNIGESGNLTTLSLSGSPLTDVQLHNILSNNPHLENLTLFSCAALERISVSSVFLKSFSLSECGNLVEIEVDAPNLNLLDYRYLFRTPLPIVRSATNGVSNISIYCGDEIDHASWFHVLREFLTKFRESNVEITSYRMTSFDSEGLRAIPPLPHGHGVERLILKYEDRISVAHLEAVLSICHPKTVLCEYEDTTTSRASLKSFCNEVKNRKNARCCDLGQSKCWRHYLKDARFHAAYDVPRLCRIIGKEISFEWKSFDD